MSWTRRLRRALFHDPGGDLTERCRGHADPGVVLIGAAGAVRVQLAAESESVTVGVHWVRLVLGHADELNEHSRTVPQREVPTAHAMFVSHASPRRIPHPEETQMRTPLGIWQREKERLHRGRIDGPAVVESLLLTAADEGDAERFRP